MKKFLIRIGGGVGKNIMATRMVESLSNTFPDAIIYVQASYPKVFANLPFVQKVFAHEIIPYFYEQIRDFQIINVEPYENLEYEKGVLHLTAAWCQMAGVKIPEKNNGIITLSGAEKSIGRQMLLSLRTDRPVVAMQIIGGTSHYHPQTANDPSRIKHYRDIPVEIAQDVVDKLIQKGYCVLQIRLPTEPVLRNTYQLSDNQLLNIRHVFAIVNECMGIISIDSMLHHLWAALDKPSKGLVLWGGTNPDTLGYPTNVNISVKDSCKDLFCNRPNTFRMDICGDGELWQCSKNGKCMSSFQPDVIVETFMGIYAKQAKV
jgi:ADP-heptose:LPS heptosyltransferase